MLLLLLFLFVPLPLLPLKHDRLRSAAADEARGSGDDSFPLDLVVFVSLVVVFGAVSDRSAAASSKSLMAGSYIQQEGQRGVRFRWSRGGSKKQNEDGEKVEGGGFFRLLIVFLR